MKPNTKSPQFIDYKKIAEKLLPDERMGLAALLMPEKFFNEDKQVIPMEGRVSIKAVQKFAHILRGDIPTVVYKPRPLANTLGNTVSAAVVKQVEQSVVPVDKSPIDVKATPKEFVITNTIPKKPKEMDEDKFLVLTRNSDGNIVAQEDLENFGGTFNYVGAYQGRKYFEQLDEKVRA
jgi:hypothetical protein